MMDKGANKKSDNAVKRNASLLNLTKVKQEKVLSVYEKKFLLCSERGDVVTVKRLLQHHFNKPNSKLDLNCVDPLGRSALVLAIENENMELIEVLLKQQGIRPGDALLHAINEEYVEAVEILLQHEEKVHQPGTPYSWETINHDISTYTKDITPLILAAHKDNYEILKILLDRGATLPLPHDVKCGCDECIAATNEDCLKYSRSRINAYHALCSPSLIALSSRDPILTAFQLSWELRRLSKVEMEFAVEYRDLRKKVEGFAVALLDHIRTTYELQVCLNYSQQLKTSKPDEQQEMKLERLKLAIDYSQKKFVAHPNVQQLLGTVWFSGMPGFRRKGPVAQAIEVIRMAANFPVYSVMGLFFPNTSLGKKIRLPFFKFVTHSSCYLFFLLLLVLASQRVEQHIVDFFDNGNLPFFIHNAHRRERGKWPTITEWFIILYVFGFVWQETKELFTQGILGYVSDMWNLVDFSISTLYMNWLLLRFWSFIQVYIEIENHRDKKINLDTRERWNPYDPMLLSEGMFCSANILSFLKLVNIFSVHRHLGPLQISLGRMVFDILKFFFLFILVVFAFGCGMNQLLFYYADKDHERCFAIHSGIHPLDQDHSCEIWRRFSSLFETSQTLFWASFGLIDLHNFDLSGIKEFTRFWGLLMFGSYSVINVVVLLNLLIAMMSSSYQIISERADTEWKFARSKLWINFFDDDMLFPSPFNLFPNVGYLCHSVKEKFGPKFSSSFRGSINRNTYENVMRCLVRRYVTREQRKAEETGAVTEDDVNEIKQDIASFRFELLDILRNNGMRCEQKGNDPNSFGKKERIRERRLLKGFNIGLVEKVEANAAMMMEESFNLSQDDSKENRGSILNKLSSSGGSHSGSIRRRIMARNRWTSAISTLAQQDGSQIGTSTPELRSSITNLREQVFKEEEEEILRRETENIQVIREEASVKIDISKTITGGGDEQNKIKDKKDQQPQQQQIQHQIMQQQVSAQLEHRVNIEDNAADDEAEDLEDTDSSHPPLLSNERRHSVVPIEQQQQNVASDEDNSNAPSPNDTSINVNLMTTETERKRSKSDIKVNLGNWF